MDVPPDATDEKVLARMEAIVLRMPRRTREIFLAHRVHDLSCEEIARRTGLTTRKVERHIARAIFALMRGLERPTRRPWWKFW